MMAGTLPPLKAIQTFCVVAQQQSFSKAGDKLFITQGAVSKQMRQLESYLGNPLFDRTGSGVALNALGLEYYRSVREGIDIIYQASAHARQAMAQAETVRLIVPPSFSSLWLIPRLSAFMEENDDIALTVRTAESSLEREDSAQDITILCQHQSVAASKAVCLVKERLLLVVKPEVLPQDFGHVDDLLALPVLSHITRPHIWEQFWQHHGVSPLSPEYGAGFEHFFMAMEAAKNGTGMALIPDFMVLQSLEEGTLCNPLQLTMDSGYSYYLYSSVYKQHSRAVSRVIDWLESQLSTSVAGHSHSERV